MTIYNILLMSWQQTKMNLFECRLSQLDNRFRISIHQYILFFNHKKLNSLNKMLFHTNFKN